MHARLFGLLVAGAALVTLAATPARADAIDGDWCKVDGKRMKIRGPQIITPGGKETNGDYTRHSFVYVVPADEAGAGETVSIILLSESLAHARQGATDAPVQVWNRCPPGVADTQPVINAGYNSWQAAEFTLDRHSGARDSASPESIDADFLDVLDSGSPLRGVRNDSGEIFSDLLKRGTAVLRTIG